MVPHGTASRYRYHGCRCDKCRAAATVAQRLDRQRLYEAGLTSEHRRPRPLSMTPQAIYHREYRARRRAADEVDEAHQ